jgi:hypothetical protein
MRLSSCWSLLLLPLVMSSGACLSAPLNFNCKSDAGLAVSDLIVDIENRWMIWGAFRYEIRSVTDRYVTGIRWGSDSIGAEVWVLDRSTGEYQRASVTMTYRAVPGGTSPPYLAADAYRGTCTRPLL